MKTILARPAPDEPGSLADWLASTGHPLNTRCGGKGVCHGCEVILDGESIRTCQVPARQFSKGDREIEIPERSIHDETLEGVSLFEIGIRRIPYRRREGIGLAIDIGTTTIAGALWDLSSGHCLAEGVISNRQRRYGDNVLARIDFATSGDGSSAELKKVLVEDSLKPLLRQLLDRARLNSDSITEGTITGNTVMLHTLLAADLSGFGTYPFTPEFLDAREVDSSEIGLADSFPLLLPPNLGAFVGADISAGLIASGEMEPESPVLYIDVGTNGEIVLLTPEGCLATATAAGPAFEGGRLSCGAPAAPGIIGELVWQENQWKPRIIGETPPPKARGMAGSAYIDFLAVGRRDGWLNPMGRLSRDHPLVREKTIDVESEPVVEITGDVFVSEADIAEIMQAKAAIKAGAMTLLEEAGLQSNDLESVIIAGGFGYHLDPAHAIRIGLLPKVEVEQIRIVGNASLAGASLILQADAEPWFARLKNHCRLIELNQTDTFEEAFIDAMALDP
jgi:uncharacterized 2Fe-2S/4Fe-4S cluster protein (DUF4445 family)